MFKRWSYSKEISPWSRYTSKDAIVNYSDVQWPWYLHLFVPFNICIITQKLELGILLLTYSQLVRKISRGMDDLMYLSLEYYFLIWHSSGGWLDVFVICNLSVGHSPRHEQWPWKPRVEEREFLKVLSWLYDYFIGSHSWLELMEHLHDISTLVQSASHFFFLSYRKPLKISIHGLTSLYIPFSISTNCSRPWQTQHHLFPNTK